MRHGPSPLALWPVLNDDSVETSLGVATSVTHNPVEVSRPSSATERFGYLVAIAVNIAMLVIANNILAWGWLPFLTADFNQLLWLIDLSFLASIAVNATYLAYDPPWLKSVCQIGLGGISLAVAVRTYQVFPFDFSASQFNWEPLARVVIVITFIATLIAMVTEMVKLARGFDSAKQE